MLHTDIDFTWFIWREEDLRKIYRYSNFEDFYYRSNVYIHCLRLFYIVQWHREVVEKLFPEIDFNKVLVLTLIHDDAEILIWDFQSANRLICSQEDLDNLDLNEKNAIKVLATKFPVEIIWYNYKQLLQEVFEYEWLEAQLVKFFDHLDWLYEALHEYFAGNTCVTIQPETKYWKPVLPFDYYINLFKKADQKYPLLASVFRQDYDFYTPFNLNFKRMDFEWNVDNYWPHICSSIKTDFEYPLYDFWKNTILESWEKSIISALTEFSAGRFHNKKTWVFSQTRQ